jgi:SAM-dependent methyltransferase
MTDVARDLTNALWRIHRRPERPIAWASGGNLPWDDPAFSARMLREHLDESHGAASRQAHERELILNWLWKNLALGPGSEVLDITCGPGLYAIPLAERGCQVLGIDFSPAAVEYAKGLAEQAGIPERCSFVEQDVRKVDIVEGRYDAALFLYGQLAVFPREDARDLLAKIARSLHPDGRLVIELLDQDKVDKEDSTWWFSDEKGLWGDAPFIHLGERYWSADQAMSIERFYILHLDSGRLEEIILCDQTYSVSEMMEMLKMAGFSHVDHFPAWAGLPLYDASEWSIFVAQKK